MIIPILTSNQPDTARSPASAPGNPRSERFGDTDPNRKDTRDFAATMSDGAQDTGSEPARPEHATDGQGRAEAARKSDKAADGTLPAGDLQNNHEEASAKEIARAEAQDSQRRQVTIPDLPVKRNEGGAPELQAAGTIRVSQPAAGAEGAATQPALAPIRASQPAAGAEGAATQPALADPDIAPGAARQAAVQSASNQPAAGESAPLRAASATAPGHVAGRADATPGAGNLAHSDASKSSPDTEDLAKQKAQATGEAARDDQRRAAPQPDARNAAGGNQVAQPARTNRAVRAESQAPAEDRVASRTRDSMSRAMETVAAAPATAPQPNAAQAAVTAQAAILQIAARDTAAAKDKAESLVALDDEMDGLRLDLRGTSSSTSAQQGSFASALSQTQLPRGIAMQLGDIVRAMPNKPVEISLSPEELGRVRLSISTSEGGVMLHVLAERPETLDLMRRHADQLARELADLGFGAIDLAFGQGRNPDSGDGDETSGDTSNRNARPAEDADTAIPASGPVNRMVLSPSGGLDIRI